MCQIIGNSEKYEYIYLNEDMNCNANMSSSTRIVKAPAVGKDSSVASPEYSLGHLRLALSIW